MPTKCGLKDKKGYFCRWGNSGKKYYYDPSDKASKERARNKANKQGQAIQVNKNEEKTEKKESKSEEKCTDCEQKALENEQKPTENEENITENDQNDDKIVEKLEKTYEIPQSKDDLVEGNYIKYKDKIGKIVKIIE